MQARSLKLQRTVLTLLADRNTDARIGRGRQYLSEAVLQHFERFDLPSPDEVQQAFWSLITQGLVFIDMLQPAPENWELKLTPAGLAAVRDEDYTPDDATGYLDRLVKEIPSLSEAVALYMREALHTYAARCYISTTVMVGVASEAAILEMAEALLSYRSDQSLREAFENPKVTYHRKFQEIRRCLNACSGTLPSELTDGMSLTFESVMELLRVNRNDAGHPSGRRFDRDDCFTTLRMAIRYLRKIYALSDFFREAPSIQQDKAP